MNKEKSQNFEAVSASSLGERQEKQKELQVRIKEMQENYSAVNERMHKEARDLQADILLTELDKRIDLLDVKNKVVFDSEVEKIEAELAVFDEAHRSFSNLKGKITAQHTQVYQQMQNQFPSSSNQANEGRAKSYEAIAEIKPQEGENKVANFFAGIVEKLVS